MKSRRYNQANSETSCGSRQPYGVAASTRHRFSVDIDLPEPFRSHLAGRHLEAADWWRRAGSPFAEAMRPVRLHGARGPGARVVLLDRLGAVGTADRMRKELRRAGMLNVPKRPNEATRPNFVRCSAHVASQRGYRDLEGAWLANGGEGKPAPSGPWPFKQRRSPHGPALPSCRPVEYPPSSANRRGRRPSSWTRNHPARPEVL